MLITIPAYQPLTTILTNALGSIDAATLQNIITANGLEWPYIVPLGTPLSDPATGSVTVTWTSNRSLTLPAGTICLAPLADQGGSRQYTLDQALSFVGPGTQTVSITAVVSGSFGNAPPGAVTSVVGESDLTITNPLALTGGSTLHVLQPGQTLWIPTSDVPTQTTTPQQNLAYHEAIGETDLQLTPDGGMQWGTNDLQLTQGATTILQDGASRIRTPLNTLPWAPDQGSLIQAAIGQPTGNVLNKLGALTLEALLQDERLGSVQVQLDQDPANPTVIVASVTNQLTNQTIQVSLNS